MARIVQRDEAAEILGIAPRTLQEWVAVGGLPGRAARGEYDLCVLVPAVIEKARAEAGENRDAEELKRKLTAAQAKEREAKASLAEMQLARENGKLLDALEVERGRIARIVAVRTALVTLGREVRGLHGRTLDEVGEWLDERVEGVCKRFAHGEEDPIITDEAILAAADALIFASKPVAPSPKLVEEAPLA